MDFFILGNPRSGTTLLRLLINEHSQLGVPPESGFMEWWYDKYKDWTSDEFSDEKKLIDFAEDIHGSKKFEGWDLSTTDIIDAVSGSTTYQYAIDSIYRAQTQKPKIGDKNNYYISILSKIDTIYPDTKYIHLVRDGRDVYNSYRNIAKIDANTPYLPQLSDQIAIVAKEWMENNAMIESFLVDKPSMTVRYEDLITDPETTLTGIFEFLGETYEPSVLHFYEDNKEPAITMEWKGKTNEEIDKNNVGKYLVSLTAEEILEFESIAGESLEKYGYK